MPFDARQVYNPCRLLFTEGQIILPFRYGKTVPAESNHVIFAAGFAAVTLQCKTTFSPSCTKIGAEMMICGCTTKSSRVLT